MSARGDFPLNSRHISTRGLIPVLSLPAVAGGGQFYSFTKRLTPVLFYRAQGKGPDRRYSFNCCRCGRTW
jgi:hypothetical protein